MTHISQFQKIIKSYNNQPVWYWYKDIHIDLFTKLKYKEDQLE